jgi:hypothetical protein
MMETAVLLQTLTKIAIRKNELTQTIKQIIKIAGLPSVKNPISNKDDGLLGHDSLALRYKIEHATT